MGKTNYSVARVVNYTKQSIGKAERHNERKNTNYSNMNVDLEQTKNNVYYKTCNTTYNERLKELVNTGKISLRVLKDNAKVFDFYAIFVSICKSNTFNHLLMIKVITKNYYAGMLLIFQFVENETY